MNTLYDAVFAQHRDNHAPFLICDDGQSISFAAFIKRTAQIAHVLSQTGISPGDRVLVQAPKVVDVLAVYAASLQIGAVYMPLNPAYTLAELSYFITDATPTVVVCDVANEGDVRTLCDPAAIEVLTLGTDGAGSLSDKANAAPDHFETVPRAPDDLAGLLYTSGTTGRSKGAMMSHRNLLSNAQALTDLWQITADDRLIHALPIFHTHGLFVAMNTALLAGACVRFMERFDVDAVLATLPRASLMMGVPTFYTRLLSDPRFTAATCENMRLFISGSAPLLAETHVAFEERTGHRILERYGMTETNMITSNPLNGARIAGTVGYALPGTEVLVTQDDAPLPAEQIGMVEVRGDNVFRGYWNMPQKTKAELRDNGFFITGDLGRMSADGRLTIVGRQKDLIISGGYNIYPKEIEDILNADPSVAESAVFGVPDPDFGEMVVATLVSNGAQIDVDAIKAAMTDQIAKFKHPRRYLIVDGLPRNAMGKVQKNLLRERFSEG